MVFTGAGLAFLILTLARATGLSAAEKREIGIFKAIGWETVDILQLKVYEGAVLSVSAFFIGVLLAYCSLALTGGPLWAQVLRGWSILSPEFQIVPYLDPLPLAVLFFLTVIPYSFANFVPAWRAANIEPDVVMRT